MKTFDLVILSNAPGELATWVYPVWQELKRQELPIRVSVILSPCVNASGNEAELLRSWGIDRTLYPQHFWQFLLWGKTPNWDWYKQGAVLFLGGDQLYAVIIGKRLQYPILIYAEWTARWVQFVDYILARNPTVKVPAKYQHKLKIVGDLMLCRSSVRSADQPFPNYIPDQPLIGLLPGSKGHKLRVGVPLLLNTAARLARTGRNLQFVIPLAPTVTTAKLMSYAPANFVLEGDRILLPTGQFVHIYSKFPAQNLLTKTTICLTTVGANTAELASLGVPMLVILPTNWDYIDVRVGWDGLLGIFNANPMISRWINKLMVYQIRQKKQKLAWPNIWAGREIVPELLGEISPELLTAKVHYYLDHPEELAQMRQNLLAVAGQNGAQSADQQIVNLIHALSCKSCHQASPSP
ncbi:MAG: lipid-A-disaccharide synthase [Pseudanabaenaceae cyanobacterium]